MRRWKVGIVGTLWLLFRALSFAQDLPFQQLTTDDGLSDNAVNCVFQDAPGIVWIGTEKGLDRYDGQRIDHVNGCDHPVSSMTEDAQGVLWITTRDHGLLRIGADRSNVQGFQHKENDPTSIPSDQLTAVYDLDDTTLLIGSRATTLLFMDKRTDRFTFWSDSTDLSPARASATHPGFTGWCHAIIPLDADHLWIGLLNAHTSFLADRRTHRILRDIRIQRPGSETQTCALVLNGRFYTGGWQNGIDHVAFDGGTTRVSPWIPKTDVLRTPDEVLALVEMPDGSILAGTRAFGLMRIDPVTGASSFIQRRRSDPNSLPSDRIRCVYLDRGGTLWVGTSNGLAYHAPAVWSFQVERIFDAQDDHQPELFFHRIEAMGAHGVRVYSSDGFFTQGMPGAPIAHQRVFRNGMDLQPTVIGADHHGRAMLGTEYGIIAGDITGDGAKEDVVLTDGLSTNYAPGGMFQVRYLNADTFQGRPVLIVGTLGFGLSVVDASSHVILGWGMPHSAMSVKARSLVTSVVHAPDGRYWIGSGDGLFTWDTRRPIIARFGATRIPVSHDSILVPGATIQQMKLRGDTVWAVTRDARLLRVVGDSVTTYTTTWTVGAMHGLEADARGRFWITTDDGLLRFDPRDASFIRVPVNDGHEFRKLTRAICALPDGTMALATSNAILRFDPAVFDRLPALPVAQLRSVSLAGDVLPFADGSVDLSYRATALDIVLSALANGLPRPLRFQYRMDGVEDEWRTTDARTPVRYAGIPVGEHRLLARVVDPYGRVSAERALLTVAVAGPIWQQWWFYILALLCITGALYALYRYRLAQAIKLQLVRNRIASDLHDEVGSSLSSITIGSKLAAQLSGRGDEQVKEILDRIGETSSESLRSMSDIVWAIDPKNDQGEALVKRMRRIASELLTSKGIDVGFSVGEGVEELRLPMNARKELVLLYKEAVHNASKYSGASTVQVSLHRRNGSISLSVKDDGRGFDPALHPDGHGLGSMQRRAQALGSVLDLKSAPGLGTLVGVEVDLARIRD